MMGRTMHGIAYDALRDEFTIPQQFAQAILTYPGNANGETRPIRIIQGPHTQLRDPDLLSVDYVHREVFVITSGAVLSYPLDGSGDVPPIRVLEGPDTLLPQDWAPLAVDGINDVLVVASPVDKEHSRFLIFNRTDSGNVKPKRIIGGPNSRVVKLGGPFAIYGPKGEIVASIRG